MQATPYLHPTVIQHLRTFLDEQAPMSPWSTSADVLDRLYGVLYARRNDAAFWTRLEQLALDLQRDLRRGPGEGLPAREAEVLSNQQIETVLEELRNALIWEGLGQGPGAMKVLLPGRTPGLAACVALLAAVLSTGCNPRETQTAPAQDGPGITADPTKAMADAMTADASGDALVQLFRDGSPEDIAATLEAMVDGGVNAVLDGSQPEAGPKPVVGSSTARPPRPRPTVQPVPRYKGVTF